MDEIIQEISLQYYNIIDLLILKVQNLIFYLMYSKAR